jgi:hypothetical protein
MVDEFPSLKRMEVFADALSYMAGYGLKAYLVTQDIRVGSALSQSWHSQVYWSTRGPGCSHW